jgi:hypothetical protein
VEVSVVRREMDVHEVERKRRGHLLCNGPQRVEEVRLGDGSQGIRESVGGSALRRDGGARFSYARHAAGGRIHHPILQAYR